MAAAGVAAAAAVAHSCSNAGVANKPPQTVRYPWQAAVRDTEVLEHALCLYFDMCVTCLFKAHAAAKAGCEAIRSKLQKLSQDGSSACFDITSLVLMHQAA